jgi:hypothetical protein
MKTKDEIQLDLENVRREYRRVASILAMMEKGTPRGDLERMRKEQLDPIIIVIKRQEEALVRDWSKC